VTPPDDPGPKRVYRRPSLAVYGGIGDLTLNAVTNNMNDRMTGSFSMT
jgi:hypothetical protein